MRSGSLGSPRGLPQRLGHPEGPGAPGRRGLKARVPGMVPVCSHKPDATPDWSPSLGPCLVQETPLNPGGPGQAGRGGALCGPPGWKTGAGPWSWAPLCESELGGPVPGVLACWRPMGCPHARSPQVRHPQPCVGPRLAEAPPCSAWSPPQPLGSRGTALALRLPGLVPGAPKDGPGRQGLLCTEGPGPTSLLRHGIPHLKGGAGQTDP